jgi:hypothetical protein
MSLRARLLPKLPKPRLGWFLCRDWPRQPPNTSSFASSSSSTSSSLSSAAARFRREVRVEVPQAAQLRAREPHLGRRGGGSGIYAHLGFCPATEHADRLLLLVAVLDRPSPTTRLPLVVAVLAAAPCCSSPPPLEQEPAGSKSKRKSVVRTPGEYSLEWRAASVARLMLHDEHIYFKRKLVGHFS